MANTTPILDFLHYGIGPDLAESVERSGVGDPVAMGLLTGVGLTRHLTAAHPDVVATLYAEIDSLNLEITRDLALNFPKYLAEWQINEAANG